MIGALLFLATQGPVDSADRVIAEFADAVVAFREAHPGLEPQLDCANAMTQADMNACAARDFEQADAELNRIWPGLIAAARAADREIDRTYDQRPGSEQMLREAQRAWIAFRDAQCTYEAAEEARGGSMEPMVFSGCATQLTRARIRQLTGADQPQPEQ